MMDGFIPEDDPLKEQKMILTEKNKILHKITDIIGSSLKA